MLGDKREKPRPPESNVQDSNPGRVTFYEITGHVARDTHSLRICARWPWTEHRKALEPLRAKLFVICLHHRNPSATLLLATPISHR